MTTESHDSHHYGSYDPSAEGDAATGPRGAAAPLRLVGALLVLATIAAAGLAMTARTTDAVPPAVTSTEAAPAAPLSVAAAEAAALKDFGVVTVETLDAEATMRKYGVRLAESTTADAATSSSVDCTAHSDCTSADAARCRMNYNVCGGCTADDHCADVVDDSGDELPACDEDAGVCVECVAHDDCTSADAARCRGNYNMCGGCTEDDHCADVVDDSGDELPVCDEDAGVCVECAAHDDCTAADAARCRMNHNVCGGCTEDDHCADVVDDSGDELPVCDEDAGLCVGCLSHDDCTAPSICAIKSGMTATEYYANANAAWQCVDPPEPCVDGTGGSSNDDEDFCTSRAAECGTTCPINWTTDSATLQALAAGETPTTTDLDSFTVQALDEYCCLTCIGTADAGTRDDDACLDYDSDVCSEALADGECFSGATLGSMLVEEYCCQSCGGGGSTCARHSDCKSVDAARCKSNAEEPTCLPCNSNGNCNNFGWDLGGVCIDGSCLEIPESCDDDDDCYSSLSSAVCHSGECKMPCSCDAIDGCGDCEDDEFCYDDVCLDALPEGVCVDDADCEGLDDASLTACVDNECVLPTTSCSAHSDCTSQYQARCRGNYDVCDVCTQDSHCSGVVDELGDSVGACDAGVCVKAACTRDSDCGAEIVAGYATTCNASGECVEPTACSANPDNKCNSVEASPDALYTEYGDGKMQSKNAAMRKCCYQTGFCTMYKCCGGSDNDCTSGYAPVCDKSVSPRICTSCADSDDCQPSFDSNYPSSTFQITRDSVWEDHYMCDTSGDVAVCVEPECTDNNHCTDLDLSKCDDESGQCVACGQNSECPDDYACAQGSCVQAPACTEHDDCTGATLARCNKSKSHCEGCLKNANCASVTDSTLKYCDWDSTTETGTRECLAAVSS